MNTLLNTLSLFLEKYQLQSKKITLGLSGGIDSVALFHLLIELQKSSEFQLSVCHINHQLRLESTEEERFVTALSETHKIPLYKKTVDVKSEQANAKESLEMVAHRLRYQVFHEALNYFNADAFFTAHHQNDQIETLFMRLGFGSGTEGIQGLAEKNKLFYKPLLTVYKSELFSYQKEKGFLFMEDESNTDTTISRNFWREDIVPPIEKRFGTGYFDNVLKTVKQLNFTENDKRLVQKSINTYNGTFPYIKILIDDYMEWYSFVRKPVLEGLLNLKFGVKHVFTSHILTEIEHLCGSESGKKIEIAPDIFIEKSFDAFYFYQVNTGASVHSVQKEGRTFFDGSCLHIKTVDNYENNTDKTIEFIDAELLAEPLEIRYINKTDYFCPLGFRGKQKVNRYLKSNNIPSALRPRIRVLCSNHQIVWIVGMRLDDRYKVTSTTGTIAKLELERNPLSD